MIPVNEKSGCDNQVVTAFVIAFHKSGFFRPDMHRIDLKNKEFICVTPGNWRRSGGVSPTDDELKMAFSLIKAKGYFIRKGGSSWHWYNLYERKELMVEEMTKDEEWI